MSRYQCSSTDEIKTKRGCRSAVVSLTDTGGSIAVGGGTAGVQCGEVVLPMTLHSNGREKFVSLSKREPRSIVPNAWTRTTRYDAMKCSDNVFDRTHELVSVSVP